MIEEIVSIYLHQPVPVLLNDAVSLTIIITGSVGIGFWSYVSNIASDHDDQRH